MAAAGTSLAISMFDVSDATRKSISVPNPNDAVTTGQVEGFIDKYNLVYGTSFQMTTAYYQDVDHRPVPTTTG